MEREYEEGSWGPDDALVFDLDAGHLGEGAQGVKIHHCALRLCTPFYVVSLQRQGRKTNPDESRLQTPALLLCLAASHDESLAPAPSTHDGISTRRHSV